MANWNNPTLTSTYTNFVTEVKDRDVEVALWFEGMSPTNLPTNAKRLNTSTGKFEKWNGTAWVDAVATFTFPAMVVNGNVGIGTSSPASKLDIGGGTSGQRLTFSNTAGNTAARTMFEIGYKTASFTGYAAIAGISETAFDDSLGLRFYTGTGSERMRIDASGNLGLGVVPSGWSAGKAFELGAVGNALWGYSGNVILSQNTAGYSGSFLYATTAAASRYQQTAGTHTWYTAPSGTAGNTITFTQAMTLDSSGNLGIGTSSPGAKLHVVGAVGNGVLYGDGTVSNFFGTGGGSVAQFGTTTSHAVQWITSGTAKATLDTNGNLGLGVTPSGWGTNVVKAIQVGTGAGFGGNTASGTPDAYMMSNCYYDGTNWRYIGTDAAMTFDLRTNASGAVAAVWNIAPSGTAGNAITFTQAMTLDANGRLIVAASSAQGDGVTIKGTYFARSGDEATVGSLSSDNTGVTSVVSYRATGGTLTFVTANSSGSNTERARIDSSGNLIANSSVTGYWQLPNGTTAQRPTGAAGMIRFNTSLAKYEGHNGTAWSSIGGGATGGGSDDIFYENGQTVTTNYTITTNKNAMSAGPITVASGITVTVPSGSTWVVV